MNTGGYKPIVRQLGPGRYEVGFYDSEKNEYRYQNFINMEGVQKFLDFLKTERKFHLGDIVREDNWRGRVGKVIKTQTILNSAPHYRIYVDFIDEFGSAEGNERFFERV